jgi:hypothetical protein
MFTERATAPEGEIPKPIVIWRGDDQSAYCGPLCRKASVPPDTFLRAIAYRYDPGVFES